VHASFSEAESAPAVRIIWRRDGWGQRGDPSSHAGFKRCPQVEGSKILHATRTPFADQFALAEYELLPFGDLDGQAVIGIAQLRLPGFSGRRRTHVRLTPSSRAYALPPAMSAIASQRSALTPMGVASRGPAPHARNLDQL
jgi:hypothetical protein